MTSRVWLAIYLALLIAPFVTAARQVDDEGATSRDQDRNQTFSPLHDFLGIDPDTGRFVDSNAKPTSERDGEGSEANDRPATSPPDRTGAPSATPRDPDDLPREAEEAAEAIRRMTERINEGSFEDLSALVGERLSNDRLFRLSRQFAWVTAGLLLLYPLSIFLSELLVWWLHRDEGGLTEWDRRYRRTRLRRRLLLAATLTGLIVLATIGSVNGYWWSQPELFTLFCIAVGLLGVAAATLASLIKQAAKQYSVTLMRQMHREQLEMRADLDELCKRMRQVTMTSG